MVFRFLSKYLVKVQKFFHSTKLFKQILGGGY